MIDRCQCQKRTKSGIHIKNIRKRARQTKEGNASNNKNTTSIGKTEDFKDEHNMVYKKL